MFVQVIHVITGLEKLCQIILAELRILTIMQSLKKKLL